MNEEISNKNESEKKEELKKAMQTFFEYLKVEDKPERSDAIFLFGGSTVGPAEKGAELYKKGYSEHVVAIATKGSFSNKDWEVPENEKYKEVLEKLKVPPEAILTESISDNTLVEAREAIPFIRKNGIDPKQIIIVSRPIHQRRAWATFQEQHPEIKYINCPADEPLDMDDLDTRKRLVAEAERLLNYSKKGDVKKQEIPYSILRAAARIRIDLKNNGEYTTDYH